MKSLRTVCATRYVTPLHEGGSLPAIVEADDDGMYVLKFRGAGQGPKALTTGGPVSQFSYAHRANTPTSALVEAKIFSPSLTLS